MRLVFAKEGHGFDFTDDRLHDVWRDCGDVDIDYDGGDVELTV